MPPTSDGIRTVGCSLEKLLPDVGHLAAIRQAVASTHKATILASVREFDPPKRLSLPGKQ